MDNQYLQNLILEAKVRGGGMILEMAGKPEVVVLTIEKYNELVLQVTSDLTSSASGGLRRASKEEGINNIMTKKILVTGGAGYIGSHTVRALINNGHEVVVIDNLSYGKLENIHPKAKFYEGDLKDINFLHDVFSLEEIDIVMHFAAFIEVEESVKEPAKYFENNVSNTVNLLNAMQAAGVKNIVFSSTGSVYGDADKNPITETSPVKPQNPYGYSKLLAEKTIKYYCQFAGFNAIIFRYFNACGCEETGSVKPTHNSHLIDNVMEVAIGNKPSLNVYGNDYPTFDGTCVRDYISVLDIANAHVESIKHINDSRFEVFNIGTGKGSSVLEIINETSEVLNKIIPMEIVERRAGDSASTVANPGKILQLWGFNPKFSDLKTILEGAWQQKKNSGK